MKIRTHPSLICLSALALLGWGCASPPDNPPTDANKRPSPPEASPPGGDKADTVERAEARVPGVLTLKAVLRLVDTHHPDLRTAEHGSERLEALKRQAELLPNPEAGVEVENLAGTGTLGGTDAAETTLRLSQLIELGGKRSARAGLADADWRAFRVRSEWERFERLHLAARDFVAALSAAERRRLVREQEELAEAVYEAVQARVEAGAAARVELTNAKAGLADARLSARRADSEWREAAIRLAGHWGDEEVRFDKLAGEFEQLRRPRPWSAWASDIGLHPELRYRAAVIQGRERSLRLEEARVRPDLTLGAGYRHMNAGDNHSALVEFSIPLPLFDRNQGRVAAAKAGRAEAAAEFEAALKRLTTRLRAAHERLSAGWAAAGELKASLLPAREEAFEATREGYREGKFSLLDLLEAQRRLQESQQQHLEALATYHRALIEAEYLSGSANLLDRHFQPSHP